jgi:ornithine carbamoyltransferase
VKFGFALRIATPKDLAPDSGYLSYAAEQKAPVSRHESASEAVKGAHAVITDTWVSMGNENSETRRRLLTPYQVDTHLMQQADKNAIFMHCLPAHRGEEVTPEVIDGPQSVVWDEAENRMHAQKAILDWCMSE